MSLIELEMERGKDDHTWSRRALGIKWLERLMAVGQRREMKESELYTLQKRESREKREGNMGREGEYGEEGKMGRRGGGERVGEMGREGEMGRAKQSI